MTVLVSRKLHVAYFGCGPFQILIVSPTLFWPGTWRNRSRPVPLCNVLLREGVGGFGIPVAQGFAAGFVLVHLIGDFQFGACWHAHSPLWSVTVWGLVSSSRLVASIADWGKKMQRCSIYKIMSILHLKLLILHLKLSILHLKMQNLHIFNFFAKLQIFATSVT